MSNYYKSDFYNKPIEVEDIDWEILVIITDNQDREIIYSWYDIVEKNTWSIYINKCLLWGFIRWLPENVLIIWFWWWTYAKYIEDNVISETKITWIDIDQTMIDIAKKEFDVKTNDLYTLDAKEALEILIRKRSKYDLILVDVYDWSCEIPEYFQEQSFINDISKLLLKDWVLSINYSDYDLEDKKRSWNYKKIHDNIISQFWKYYSHLLAWENDRWNVMWIYNLDKNYTEEDYNLNYLEMVQNWDIVYDENIIRDTILDK